MFSDLAKSWRLLAAAALFPILVMGIFAVRNFHSPGWQFGASGNHDGSRSSDAIGQMSEALDQERANLTALEREQSRWRLEVINRRKLYQDGQASKDQVQEAEQAFIASLKRVHATRESVVEIDIAITEAVLGEKVNWMPVLPVNGYSETRDLARFNGSFKWSLKEAPRIERYFSQTFGRRLPVTAMGQSATHNRLRFDHRDSMDVALHPDSAEGKALIDHLRKSGIPFIAFRGASPGVSTGPHIHIGKPSARIEH
jgi:hypothetical protein